MEFCTELPTNGDYNFDYANLDNTFSAKQFIHYETSRLWGC